MVEAHDINQQPNVADWFKSLPVITQYWFGATIVVTLAGNFGVISPMNFVWAWERVTGKFELWRALSCFLFAGPFSFNTLISVCTLYFTSSS